MWVMIWVCHWDIGGRGTVDVRPIVPARKRRVHDNVRESCGSQIVDCTFFAMHCHCELIVVEEKWCSIQIQFCWVHLPVSICFVPCPIFCWLMNLLCIQWYNMSNTCNDDPKRVHIYQHTVREIWFVRSESWNDDCILVFIICTHLNLKYVRTWFMDDFSPRTNFL